MFDCVNFGLLGFVRWSLRINFRCGNGGFDKGSFSDWLGSLKRGFYERMG